METMGEFYNAIKIAIKEEKDKKEKNFLPILKKYGAIFKSDGVYEMKIKDEVYFYYPRKGYAMNKRNNKIKISLSKLFKDKEQQEIDSIGDIYYQKDKPMPINY